MAPLTSRLFAGDELLQAIADDVGRVRISRSANATGPSVGRVQRALLLWRPGILPTHGPDESYGGETARAVHVFKVEELGVPEAEVIDDVGPKTVARLDEIARSLETDDEPDQADPVTEELRAAVRVAAPGLLALPGVLGVGAALRYDGEQVLDEPVVEIFVEEESMAAAGIPGQIAGVGVVVTPATIEPCADENPYPELKGGIRINHPSRSSAGGTLGAIVKDNASGELLGLTDQHAVGDAGGPFPDVVYQPVSPLEARIAGTPPDKVPRTEAVGAVTRSERPRPDPRVAGAVVSDMDAAVFRLDELSANGRTTSPAIVGKDALGANLIDAVKATRFPVNKMKVRKRGITTLLTFGTVTCTSFHCCWQPGGKNHHLVEQALVLSADPMGSFCEPGDSGAVVLEADAPTAVGLLYGQIIHPTGRYGIIGQLPFVERRLGITVAWA
jgi:hypothetical protein